MQHIPFCSSQTKRKCRSWNSPCLQVWQWRNWNRPHALIWTILKFLKFSKEIRLLLKLWYSLYILGTIILSEIYFEYFFILLTVSFEQETNFYWSLLMELKKKIISAFSLLGNICLTQDHKDFLSVVQKIFMIILTYNSLQGFLFLLCCCLNTSVS